MDSFDVRKSFLEFFESKKHEIVKSSSLMPDSQNLLFTNAGMNQFVPYFLEERVAPFRRAADTQKCIRAGGKHNDLEDVGFDTYHHTFFEMLGNWSFGDYFKKEAIEWAWELMTRVWKFPKDRLYATVYRPLAGQPAEFDKESYDIWKNIFDEENMNPDEHICFGGAKENFWMMGDTGPCGPCSEIHFDLSEDCDTRGSLVNMDNPRCIELWNLVFMQFNAKQDGSFEHLPHSHVDTGMGLERVVGILSKTKNFTNFTELPSNYDSDLFKDIFTELEKISSKKYKYTVAASRSNISEQEFIDFAFRAIADHIRTLCFAISDGIFPSNEGRGYVLRRILRRAVMFGKRLGLHNNFLVDLSKIVVNKMGSVFDDLNKASQIICKVLQTEERSFSRTIDRGMCMIQKILSGNKSKKIKGEDVFALYDTYGFPVDLTQLLATEKGFSVDINGFEKLMDAQKNKARQAQKKSIVELTDSLHYKQKSEFVGYDVGTLTNFHASVVDIVSIHDEFFVVFDKTPFYSKGGGQCSDIGSFTIGNNKFEIVDVKKDKSGIILHKVIQNVDLNLVGSSAVLDVNIARRIDAQRNHTATHLLHWALKEILGSHVKQAGSSVDCDSLRFDFNHFESLTKEKLNKIEKLVQLKILENASVMLSEVPFYKKPENCIANFGEKYESIVRVVNIGNFSVELCGGCHVKSVGEICDFVIISEGAVSSGIRRIEALTGRVAFDFNNRNKSLIGNLCSICSCSSGELCDKIEKIQQKLANAMDVINRQKSFQFGDLINAIVAKAKNENELKTVKYQIEGDAQYAKQVAVAVSKNLIDCVIIEARTENKVHVVVVCSSFATTKNCDAVQIVRKIVLQYGGNGGGRPDFAMGSYQAR